MSDSRFVIVFSVCSCRCSLGGVLALPALQLDAISTPPKLDMELEKLDAELEHAPFVKGNVSTPLFGFHDNFQECKP